MSSTTDRLTEGLALYRAGRLDEARAAYEDVLAEDPGNADALHLLAHLTFADGDAEGALALVEKARAADAGPMAYHNTAGSILAALGRTDEAMAAYVQALRRAPDSADAIFNIGLLRLKAGERDAAERHFRLASAADPGHAAAWFNLGGLARARGDFAEAEACLRNALAARPDYALAHNALATVLHHRHAYSEAVEHYHRAVALAPDRPDFHVNLGHLYKALGDVAEAQARFVEAMALDSHHLDARRAQLELMAAQPGLTLDEIAAVHRAFGEWVARERPRVEAATPDRDRSPERRLRVGYVTSYVRDHPHAQFVEALLLGHDRSAVHITLYAEIEAPDPVTTRLRSLADGWRETTGRLDAEVAAMVRADKVDILVFLGGHFDHNRPTIAAQRAAPVQIGLLDVATSGLADMDYLILDRTLYQPGTQGAYTERVLRLPRADMYLPIPDAPQPTPPPLAERGIATFGVFTPPARLNDAALTLWAELAAAAPETRFVFTYKTVYASEMARRRILAPFLARGIAAERIVFDQARDDRYTHLDRVAEADIALDPFPFSGGPETFECLWMGVPVVTLPGETPASRLGASVLAAAGIEGLTATDAADYVRIAASLAADADDLAIVRAGLRDKVLASPLCDVKRRTRQLERLYRAVWRRWLASV